MPDRGRRRQGRAWPPPHPLQDKDDEDHRQKPRQEQGQHKQRQQTRWRELQAAFQRSPSFMHASQDRQEKDAARPPRSGVDEAANDLSTAEHVRLHQHASLSIMPAPATTQSTIMERTARDGEEYSFDNSPLPSPALVSGHPSTACTDDAADLDATPKASVPSRSGRARGIFKVSSFLSLRSSNFGQFGNSSGNGGGSVFAAKSRKGNDGDSRTTTPLASPMDVPLAWSGSDVGRGTDASRDGSWAGGHNRDTESKSEYFNLGTTPATTPTLHATISNTSSVPPTPVSATVPHDWKQWDPCHGKDPSCLVNAADFTWHRPSFKQIIESLQVAVVSGDTVSPLYPAGYASLEPAERRPSTSQSVFSGGAISSRSKRRPSKPTPPSSVPASPGNPIPGRYRSHIMCAIEGIHDMQASLDSANKRAAEAEESRVRDLVQFAGLSEEWAERERQYELEISRLKEAMTAAASSPLPMRHRRMFSSLRSDESSGQAESKPVGKIQASPGAEAGASAGAHDTFMNRVRAAIESSSRTARAEAAEEEARAAVDKRQAKPALICDLQHDRLMSDRLFWELSVAERNRCRQRRRYAARDQPLGQPDAASESIAWGMPKAKTDTAARTKRESLQGAREPATRQGDTDASQCRTTDATIRKKKRRAKGVRREEAHSIGMADYVDDALFDTSPCQSAPSPALALGVAQPDAKLVRWSTSQPFSPPGSEDDNSDEDDGGGSESDEASGSSPSADSRSVSGCTVVCRTLAVS